MLRSDLARVSTASVSVCGFLATTHVISVVIGRPCSSTVATTQVCPPSRNCTSGGGISPGGVMDVSVERAVRARQRNGELPARLDARSGEMRTENGARLIALRPIQLSSDEREQGFGTACIRPLAERAQRR